MTPRTVITVEPFTKREPVNLSYQGSGIFEYTKLRVLKDGREMTTLNLNEARELRNALIKQLPQGLLLSDLAEIAGWVADEV